MDSIKAIQEELRRATQAKIEGNIGKVRTCARRASGLALMEFYKQKTINIGKLNFISLLRMCMEDEAFPDEIRAAAWRLQHPIASNLSSPSVNPIDDATVIINYIQSNKKAPDID